MKINKPKFWNKNRSSLSFLLLPLSLIFQLVLYLQRKILKPKSFKIPTICVGNIYIGGTGKTPTSILIANELSKYGKKPSIVKKFYKNHSDEHDLIRNYYNDLILPKKKI